MKVLISRLAALERRVNPVPPDTVLLVMKDGSKRPISAHSIVEMHENLLARVEAWHKAAGAFPLPEHVIAEIPMVREVLDSVGVERDLPAKYPNIPAGPVVSSIKLLVERAPRQISRDEEGEYMMLPSIAGPIRICFVEPRHETAEHNQSSQ
jgi:hypothetical protein